MTARAASSASRTAIIAAHLYMRGTVAKTYIAEKFFIRAWAIVGGLISFLIGALRSHSFTEKERFDESLYTERHVLAA